MVVKLLQDAGFKQIQLYGNFKGEQFTMDSVPLIIEAS